MMSGSKYTTILIKSFSIKVQAHKKQKHVFWKVSDILRTVDSLTISIICSDLQSHTCVLPVVMVMFFRNRTDMYTIETFSIRLFGVNSCSGINIFYSQNFQQLERLVCFGYWNSHIYIFKIHHRIDELMNLYSTLPKFWEIWKEFQEFSNQNALKCIHRFSASSPCVIL